MLNMCFIYYTIVADNLWYNKKKSEDIIFIALYHHQSINTYFFGIINPYFKIYFFALRFDGLIFISSLIDHASLLFEKHFSNITYLVSS